MDLTDDVNLFCSIKYAKLPNSVVSLCKLLLHFSASKA